VHITTTNLKYGVLSIVREIDHLEEPGVDVRIILI
jgi:hypothetical protein